MVPQTADSVLDEDPLGERTVVVGAMRPDRQHLQAAAHQQNLLVTDMTNELATVGKLAKNNALRQIGARELRLILSHVLLLLTIRDRIRLSGTAPACIRLTTTTRNVRASPVSIDGADI